MEAQLDPIFLREVNFERVPGVAAIALDATENVLLTQGLRYHYCQHPDTPPVTMDARTSLFSCSKIVTSVAAL